MQELVVIEALRHLHDLLVEEVGLLDADLGQDLLDGAVYNADHVLMLSDLAPPHKVNYLVR